MPDSEVECEVSVEDQKNKQKYFYIAQNTTDLSLISTKIIVRDKKELKLEPMYNENRIKKLKRSCLGKTHVIYCEGDQWNDVAIELIEDENHEDKLIFGDVILFCDNI